MPIQLHLTNWQIVVIFLGTMFFSAIAVVLPFYMISRSERMTETIVSGNSVFLRFVTVIIVVWSAAVLALLDHMNEGLAAIYGTVIGYVFGAVRPMPGLPKKSSPPNRGESIRG